MLPKVRSFISGLLYENGQPSLTRCVVAAAFAVFVAGTIIDIILAWYGKFWQNYNQFAAIAGGGSITGQIANKITNSVFNSPRGQMPEKSGGNQ